VRTIDELVLWSGAPGRARARHRSRGFEVEVPGTVLEAQLELDDDRGFVLLLTDDRPYEETLYVVLLDRQGTMLEQLTLEQPYAPGVLEGVEIVAPAVLRFRFFAGTIHELRIHARPRGLLRRRRLELRASPAST
jgi:hypothetical protein